MIQPIRPCSLRTAPAPSFEQPFEMLEACHERVIRTLLLLTRLRAHMKTHGADDDARSAAHDVMRYFDRAAPEHHRDEELHVFPPLLAQGDAGVIAVVKRLQQDHVRMEQLWAAARDVLRAVEAGELAALSPDDEAILEAFALIYTDHINDEERIAYPAAAALLSATSVEAMSRDMMQRRGVVPPGNL